MIINGTREFGPAPLPDDQESITVTLTRWPQIDRFLTVDPSISLDGGTNWIRLGSFMFGGGPASTRPGTTADIVFQYSTLPAGVGRLVKCTATSTGGAVNTDPTIG